MLKWTCKMTSFALCEGRGLSLTFGEIYESDEFLSLLSFAEPPMPDMLSVWDRMLLVESWSAW